MRKFFRILLQYKRVEKPILRLITAEFFLQLINLSFFLILNLHMEKQGYRDFEIANFVSFRFLAVMLLAFPLGLYIKGRRLWPFFMAASIMLPLFSLLILYGINQNLDYLLYMAFPLWGLSFTFIQITAIPYILRNSKKENHSEAIALNFATWSISFFMSGLVIAIFNTIDPHIFSEQNLLVFFCLAGFVAIYHIFKMGREEVVPEVDFSRFKIGNYNWNLILRAVIPTFIIAVGAGLTIPFINLFFFHVYQVDSNLFSLMGSTTAVLVIFTSLIVPQVKRKYGYKVAITLSQSLAVIALVFLAATEHFSHLNIAFIIAVFCYIIRQPLMNMAGPMTSELGMYYVGPNNQEIMSALNASIWSGSWFVSSQIFRILRAQGLSYSTVFYITAALYAVGVLLYFLLIKDFYRRKEKGLIVET